MKFLECEAILIQEDNPITLVEKVGRTCYKSEDKITEDSARAFVEGLAKRHHFAMLEHGRIHFEITGIEHLPFALAHIPYGVYTPKCYRGEVYHYLTLSMSHLYQFAEGRDYDLDEFGKHLMEGMWNCFFDTYLNPVSGDDGVSSACNSCGIHIRVIKNLEEMVDYSIADFEKHHSYTFRYICDRGVSHELVRHRVALGQESTRYVAYDKAKYGAQIVFIPPADYDEWSDEEKAVFERSCKQAEENYMELRNMGKSPQQARAVLTNGLKTEVVMTAFVNQWVHFFDVRHFGVTGAPHPDMKKVAERGYQLFDEARSKDMEYFW